MSRNNKNKSKKVKVLEACDDWRDYDVKVYENDEIQLDTFASSNTSNVWLSQSQMGRLFKKDVSTISRHVRNAFLEELEENEETVRYIRVENSDKPVSYYNLDVIISVGYRVKSTEGIKFRKWANKVLKDYIIEGYAVDYKRLEELNKVNIENSKLILELNKEKIRSNSRLFALKSILSYTDEHSINDMSFDEVKSILNVLQSYDEALNILDKYDHQEIERPVGGSSSNEMITYEDCLSIINELHYKNDEGKNLFAIERNKENNGGLQEIIYTVYQTWGGVDLYETIEEKAATFLYLIIKNHTFVDGNKRIGATLFIYFLQYYNILYKNGVEVIDNDTLVALTLLIAQSDPKEKKIIISIIMSFLMK